MRERTILHLWEVVVSAEESGWDLTHPRMLTRARDLLERIVRAEAPMFAVVLYGAPA